MIRVVVWRFIVGLPARALSCPVAVWGVLSGTKIGLDREPEQSEAKTKEANVSRMWGHPLEQGPKQQTATGRGVYGSQSPPPSLRPDPGGGE